MIRDSTAALPGLGPVAQKDLLSRTADEAISYFRGRKKTNIYSNLREDQEVESLTHMPHWVDVVLAQGSGGDVGPCGS